MMEYLSFSNQTHIASIKTFSMKGKEFKDDLLVFPITLKKGMSFANYEQVLSFLDEEAVSRKLPLGLYRSHPNRTITCRTCHIYTSFVERGGHLVASTIHTQHNHPASHQSLNRRLIVDSEFKSFVFPTSIIKGMCFQSPDEIRQVIEKEAYSRGLSLGLFTRCNQLHRINYHPYLRYNCKICRCSLNFVKRGIEIVATTLQIHHKHDKIQLQQYEKRKRRQRYRAMKQKAKHECQEYDNAQRRNNSDTISKEEEIKEYVGPQHVLERVHPQREVAETAKEQLDHPLIKSQNVFSEQYPLLKEKNKGSAQEKQREFSIIQELEGLGPSPLEFLQEWLNAHNYEYRMVSTQTEDTDSIKQEIFVLSSLLMNRNYAKYGDLLAFEVLPEKIRTAEEHHSYHVGVFAVGDTNTRILLAGIVFFAKMNSQSLHKAISTFFSIHGECKTILTRDTPTITEAIVQYRLSASFAPIHILDTQHIMRALRLDLSAKQYENVTLMVNLLDAITTRDYNIYKEKIQKLTSNILDTKLLKQKQKIFYCELGSNFLGIRRDYCDKICGFFQEMFLSKNVTFDEFIQRVDHLDSVLSRQSENEYDMETESLEVQFGDPRITQIRKHFQRKIFGRFMENYICAMTKYRVTKENLNKKTTVFVVESQDSEKKFVVRGWQCPCSELEKTGVACPHIIAAAFQAKNKPYTELISERWRKDWPQQEQ